MEISEDLEIIGPRKRFPQGATAKSLRNEGGLAIACPCNRKGGMKKGFAEQEMRAQKPLTYRMISTVVLGRERHDHVS